MINKKNVMFGVLSLVLMMSFVSAFGVGAKFSDDRAVKMYAGEAATIDLFLQNMVGETDYTFIAGMRSDGGVATLGHEDPIYAVPAHTRDVAVPVDVEIPKDAQIGEYFEFDVVFSQAPSGGTDGGMVQVVGGMNWRVGIEIVSESESTFYDVEAPKVIVEEPEKSNTLWYIIVAIIIIVAILYFVTKKKK